MLYAPDVIPVILGLVRTLQGLLVAGAARYTNGKKEREGGGGILLFIPLWLCSASATEQDRPASNHEIPAQDMVCETVVWQPFHAVYTPWVGHGQLLTRWRHLSRRRSRLWLSTRFGSSRTSTEYVTPMCRCVAPV